MKIKTQSPKAWNNKKTSYIQLLNWQVITQASQMELRYWMVVSKPFDTTKKMKDGLVIENGWTKVCFNLGN